MKYYAVGAPVNNRGIFTSMWFGSQPSGNVARTQHQLEKEFFSQTTVHLFSSQDDAINYARHLRISDHHISDTPFSSLNIYPIYVLDLEQSITVKLSNWRPKAKKIVEVNAANHNQINDDTNQDQSVHYKIPTSIFKKRHMVRIEFCEKNLPPLDCAREKSRSCCRLL